MPPGTPAFHGREPSRTAVGLARGYGSLPCRTGADLAVVRRSCPASAAQKGKSYSPTHRVQYQPPSSHARSYRESKKQPCSEQAEQRASSSSGSFRTNSRASWPHGYRNKQMDQSFFNFCRVAYGRMTSDPWICVGVDLAVTDSLIFLCAREACLCKCPELSLCFP